MTIKELFQACKNYEEAHRYIKNFFEDIDQNDKNVIFKELVVRTEFIEKNLQIFINNYNISVKTNLIIILNYYKLLVIFAFNFLIYFYSSNILDSE